MDDNAPQADGAAVPAAEEIRMANRERDVFRQFAVDMMGIQTEEELFWYVARNVVGRLDFLDCVIYRLDADAMLLEQMAAFGDKTEAPDSNTILNRLTIPLGHGITGSVARSRQPILVGDLEFDPRYISDLMEARSEICVPILDGDTVLGVIDSEHPEPDFFTPAHLDILVSVAALTSAQLKQVRLMRETREARDVADRALEQSTIAQQSQARFLANASHELRTPLNAIVGFAGLLSTEGYIERDIATAREFADNIKRSGEFLTKTFNAILDLSAIAGGRMKIRPDDLDVNVEIEQVLPLMSHAAELARVTLEIETDPADPVVHFDIRHFRQVITSLLDNAIKYSRRDECIRIQVASREDEVAVHIHDRGLGIAPDSLDAVFEPFERAENAANQDQKGVGLGLAVARELARANLGDVDAESVLGEGSIFTLRMPRVAEKRDKEKPPSPE